MAHRDLSLDNVLIVPRAGQLPTLKLADFGFAAKFAPGELATTYPVCTCWRCVWGGLVGFPLWRQSLFVLLA